MNRTPLARRTPLRASSTPLARTGHIRYRSVRRAGQERVYARLRVEFLTVNPWCAAGARGCTGQATDVHHMAGRVGALLTDVDRWLPVCRSCHTVITERPRYALAMGWSEPRTGAR